MVPRSLWCCPASTSALNTTLLRRILKIVVRSCWLGSMTGTLNPYSFVAGGLAIFTRPIVCLMCRMKAGKSLSRIGSSCHRCISQGQCDFHVVQPAHSMFGEIRSQLLIWVKLSSADVQSNNVEAFASAFFAQGSPCLSACLGGALQFLWRQHSERQEDCCASGWRLRWSPNPMVMPWS